MKMILNGRSVEIEEKLSVLDLMLTYKVKTGAVIVSVNEKVLKPDELKETMVCEGDRMEFVSLVGGG
jgi:thiamine biosynthesis protein ThiS